MLTPFIPLHEDDKKFMRSVHPWGSMNIIGCLKDCATLMRMMLTVFGDQNFLSLLCYLDDLLVFRKTEQESLERLKMVFQQDP